MFERYSESARRALFFARYESSMKGSPAIEAEHLLAGLLREEKGVVPRVLRESNAPPESLQQELERRVVSRGKISTSIEIPFSPETKAVLQFTVEEADSSGSMSWRACGLAVRRPRRWRSVSMPASTRSRGLLMSDHSHRDPAAIPAPSPWPP